MRCDLKLARKMKVKQKQVERPAQKDLTETGKISPMRTQGTGPRPRVKEKVKPRREASGSQEPTVVMMTELGS